MKRALFFWLVIIACSIPQKRDGDVLTIGAWYDIGQIDPIKTSGGGGYFLAESMFDGLVKNDENFGLRLGLAERWEVSGDGKTWRFFLRQGVKFHDGQELTSEDAKFTMDRIMDPETHSPFASALDGVKDFEEKGRYEIEVHMKQPNYSLIHFCDFGIVPKHLYGKKEFNDMPVGTGPFKFVNKNEKEIFLQANKDYFLGRPHLDGIRVKTYKTQTEAWARLMAGDIDVFQPVLPRNSQFLASIPDMRLYSSLYPYYYILGFNMKDNLFKDRNVRLALNFAVDKQALIRDVLSGKGRECSGPLFPGTLGYDRGSPIPYDPEKAIEILKSSGWLPGKDGILRKNGKPLEISCLTFEGDEIIRETGLVLQEQFTRIGVRMALESQSLQEHLTSIKQRKFQTLLGYYIALFDPDIHYRLFHSSQAIKGFNWLSYKNPVVDELLEKGRMELDQEKRTRIYSLFQREIQDDPPGVFLFWMEYLAGVHKRFRGVKMGPGGLLWNIGEWWVPKEEQRYN